jgi:hypothetical protein
MLTDKSDGYFTIVELEVWKVEFIVIYNNKFILYRSDQNENQKERDTEKESTGSLT